LKPVASIIDHGAISIVAKPESTTFTSMRASPLV
jgi:hypothetical protein